MRPDYCPIGNEPCQSLCDTPCTRTPQRTWVGLTDEEIAEIYNQKDWDIHTNWDYERAIEAKLRSKND